MTKKMIVIFLAISLLAIAIWFSLGILFVPAIEQSHIFNGQVCAYEEGGKQIPMSQANMNWLISEHSLSFLNTNKLTTPKSNCGIADLIQEFSLVPPKKRFLTIKIKSEVELTKDTVGTVAIYFVPQKNKSNIEWKVDTIKLIEKR